MLSNHPSVLGSGGGTAYDIIGGTGLFADGTAAAPSISFASDSDTGFYRVTSGLLGFASNGVSSLIFRDGGSISGNGAQFITLNSGGAISLTGGGTNQNITLTPSGTGSVYVDAAANTKLLIKAGGSDRLELQASGTDGYISGPTGAIIFRTNGSSEAFRAFANQRVGIGTGATDSGALLQLGGAGTTTAATNGIVFCTDTTIHRNSAGLLRFGGTQTTASLNMGTAGYISLGNVSGGSCEVRLLSAGSIDLVSNGTTALTLDASQTATFSAAAAPGFVAKFNQVGGTNPAVLLQEGGVSKSQWSTFSGDVYFDSLTAGKSVVFRSGAQVTALTLDGSQNATFAAAVTHSSVTGLGLTATSSTWAALGVGTTARSSLRMGHGVAPTSPVDGDMWTTTAGAFIRINGVTKTFTLI